MAEGVSTNNETNVAVRPRSTLSHTHTPWGTSQSARHYTEGLVFYSTAGHGGFHVAKTLLSRIPDYLQTADGYADGTKGWFEEDCAAAIVIVCFPEFFSKVEWAAAAATMKHTYPEQWARFSGAEAAYLAGCDSSFLDTLQAMTGEEWTPEQAEAINQLSECHVDVFSCVNCSDTMHSPQIRDNGQRLCSLCYRDVLSERKQA